MTEFNARRTGGTQWIPLLERWQSTSLRVAHARHEVSLPPAVPGERPASWADLGPAFGAAHAAGAPVYAATVRALANKRRSYGIVAGGADAAEAAGHADRLCAAVADRLATRPTTTPPVRLSAQLTAAAPGERR